MDKSMFDKYIKEMRAMKASAMPQPEVPESTPQVNLDTNSENMSGMGRLLVNVTSLRGLYPVAGADVTVFTGDLADMNKIAQLTTDQSGKTREIELPAPSSDFTEQPDPSERPYALYNIRTVADGFVETINYNVAVFDAVTSLQNVSLFPVTSSPEGNRPIVIDEFENYEL